MRFTYLHPQSFSTDTFLIILPSAFFHKKSFAGTDEPYVGQAVSFCFEEGAKGAAAVKVRKEEGGVAEREEEEEEREMGKVKVCKRHSPIHVSVCEIAVLDRG